MSVQEDTLLRAAEKIGAEAGRRGREIDQTRSIPDDIIADLKSAGFLRLLAPAALGGDEADLSRTLRVVETLARGDASTAWVAMQEHHGAVLPVLLPKASYEAIYAGGPDVAWANSMVPGGRAERVDGGFRVTGRWPFASGCAHADWIFALCIETENGQPVAPAVPGHPPLIGITAPALTWTIEDTWRASGLRGTGSHHISMQNVFIPQESTFPFFDGVPSFPGPMYRYGLHLITLQFAAMAVGTAQGAVDDLVALAAAGKTYTFAPTPMKDSEVFQQELGKVEAELRAARAFLYSEAERLWTRAVEESLDDADLVRAAQARTWIAAAAARVADACYTLGGSASVTDDSPLGRRMRDAHAITQHVTLNTRQYAFAGALLAGHPARNPLGG